MNNYYKEIYKKLQDKEFKILKINSLPVNNINIHIETLNYILWEWNQDHKDQRNDIFNYVVIPNNSDFDFTKLTLDDFLTQFMKLKDEKNIQIDIKNIETITETPILKEEIDDFWL
jgi:hypothetical protein